MIIYLTSFYIKTTMSFFIGNLLHKSKSNNNSKVCFRLEKRENDEDSKQEIIYLLIFQKY